MKGEVTFAPEAFLQLHQKLTENKTLLIRHQCRKIIVIRMDCFQNKSKFVTEDHFTKHMNITIR